MINVVIAFLKDCAVSEAVARHTVLAETKRLPQPTSTLVGDERIYTLKYRNIWLYWAVLCSYAQTFRKA